MKNRFFLLLFLIVSLQGISQDGEYTFDPERSKVEFEINHMGFFKVDGSYDEFEGDISFGNGVIQNASMTVAVSSFFTDNEKRDENMMAEGYLDSTTYPEIVFTTKGEQEDSRISGVLTIKGVSRTVEFPYDLEFDPRTDAFILNAETTINRKDFNLIFDSMNGLVGNRIKLKFKLSGRK